MRECEDEMPGHEKLGCSRWPLRRFAFRALNVDEFQPVENLFGFRQILCVTSAVNREYLGIPVGDVRCGTGVTLSIRRPKRMVQTVLMVNQDRKRHSGVLLDR